MNSHTERGNYKKAKICTELYLVGLKNSGLSPIYFEWRNNFAAYFNQPICKQP